MEGKIKILRYFTYALEIVILYVLSGIPGFLPAINGVKPLLILPVAITIAVFEKEIPAMAFGLACGALCDIGYSDTIGFYTISLTILCFFFGYCARNFFVTNFSNAMAIGFTTIPILISLYFLFFVNGTVPHAGDLFLRHYIIRILYTAVFLPPLFFLNRLLHTSMSDR